MIEAEKLQAVLDLEIELAGAQARFEQAKAELDPALRVRLFGPDRPSPDTSPVAVEAVDPKTGKVVHTFASTRAAERYGFKQPTISACINGKLKRHRGLIWRRVTPGAA